MDGESSRHDKLESMLQDQNSEPRDLSLEYLRKITNDFSGEQLLGEGGFGKVYKGVLQNGKMVAVKKLDQLEPGVQEKQFENEVRHLIRLKHPNIVRFVGYCYETQNKYIEFNGKYIFAETQQRLLCLEYLSHGSLDGYLSDESSGLDWDTRYRIIKGICCGIHYLHEECQNQINGSIIHLDLKPANILLDENMEPKVADFGLSRLFGDKKTQTCTTNIAGTFGYMAPEYIYGHVITTKADIYSLGVLIVEIIMGDKINPFNFSIVSSLKDFVEALLKNWRNRVKAAPSETDCKQIKCCLEIGLSCVNVNRNERPTIKEIVDMLNKWESTHSENKLKSTHSKNKLKSTHCCINNEATPPADKFCGSGSDGGVASIVSQALFEQMLLHRNEASCQARGFYTYDAFIAAADAFEGFGTTGNVNTQKREIAAFLAQTSHETSGGWSTAPDGPYSWGYCFKQESGDIASLPDYCDRSNSRYPCAPGKKYYGRGPFQISYNFNYGPAGQAIGVDLLNNPDLVAMDPTVSFKTAIWFWMTAQPPNPSCHDVITGQWIPSGADLAVTTNIIRGGSALNNKDTHRIGFYKRYCDILAVGYGESFDCVMALQHSRRD